MSFIKPELLLAMDARKYEVTKRIANESLTIEDVLAGLQGIIEGIYPIRPAYPLPYQLVAPHRQIQRATEFLALCGGEVSTWSIPEVPHFVPRTSTELLLLAIYLPDEGELTGEQHTAKSWWDFIVPPIGFSKKLLHPLYSDFTQLRLVSGIEHRPGIRWVVFDPSANLGKSPKVCWEDPNVLPTLAGPEVLMALAYFPEWVSTWADDCSPQPDLSGYQANSGSKWDYCPCFMRWDKGHELQLLALNAADGSTNWASPSVRDLSTE